MNVTDTNGILANKIKTFIIERKELVAEDFLEQLILKHSLHLLSDLDKAFASNSLEQVEKILEKNWHNIKGTCLSYTALPDEEITKLICEICMHVGKQKDIPPVNLLLPGVAIESQHDKFPNIEPNNAEELQIILKTHTLGDTGQYLIPIAILTDLTTNNQKLHNSYFDYSYMNGQEAYINENEFQRLISHSKDTTELHQALTNYRTLSTDDKSLLGQLNLLIKSLTFNSAAGVGSEENAGDGAYDAIIRFNHYYKNLTEEQIRQIPQDMQEGIYLLLELSSDSSKNINATENLDTCLATRSRELRKLTEKYASLLIQIGVDDKAIQNLLAEAKTNFSAQQKNLADHLSNQVYTGTEKLPVSYQLLNQFKIDLNITSQETFHNFLKLNANDIEKALSNDKSLCLQLIEQINDINTFTLFSFNGCNTEQLKVILSKVGDKIASKILVDENDIIAIMNLLEGERLDLVMKAFKFEFISVIDREKEHTNGAAINYILKNIPSDKKNVFLSSFENNWSEIIHSPEDAIQTLEHLNSDERKIVLKNTDHIWQKISQDLEYLVLLLRHIKTEERMLLFNILKGFPNVSDALSQLYHKNLIALLELSAEDIKKTLSQDAALRQMVINSIQDAETFALFTLECPLDKLDAILTTTGDELASNIINNRADVMYSVILLEGEKLALVGDVFKNRFMRVLSEYDIRHLFQKLSTEQTTAFLTFLSNHWVQIIHDLRDATDMIELLNSEQKKIFIESMKDVWKNVEVYDSKNLVDFLALFSLREIPNIYNDLKQYKNVAAHSLYSNQTIMPLLESTAEDIKEKLSQDEELRNTLISAIDNSSTFVLLALECPLDKLNAIIETIGPELSKKIIKDYEDIIACSCLLQKEKFQLVVSTFREQFIDTFRNKSKHIRTVVKLDYILNRMTSMQMNTFFDAFKNDWDKLIENFSSLESIHENFSYEQFLMVLHALGDNVVDILTADNSVLYNYEGLFNMVNADDHTFLREIIKNNFSKIVSANNFAYMLDFSDPEQRALLVQFFQDDWINITKNNDPYKIFANFTEIFAEFTDEEKKEVLKNILPNLKIVVTTGSDVLHFLPYLDTEQAKFFIKSLADKFPQIIDKFSTLTTIIPYLDEDTRVKLFKSIEDNQYCIFEDFDYLNKKIKALTDDERNIILDNSRGAWKNLLTRSLNCESLKYFTQDQRTMIFNDVFTTDSANHNIRVIIEKINLNTVLKHFTFEEKLKICNLLPNTVLEKLPLEDYSFDNMKAVRASLKQRQQSHLPAKGEIAKPLKK